MEKIQLSRNLNANPADGKRYAVRYNNYLIGFVIGWETYIWDIELASGKPNMVASSKTRKIAIKRLVDLYLKEGN